jgi:oxygen-independent coproporphyrinogen-3 oxidase
MALELAPDHLSVYGLTYEEGTPLTGLVKRGDLCRIPEALEREMFLLGIDRLTAAGFEHYEVSNYCLPGHRSRHNQAYWNQEDYLGVGPSACSTLGDLRFHNVGDVEAYVRGLRDHGEPPRRVERLSAEDKLNEHLLLSLRRREGLSSREFLARAGRTLQEHAGSRIEMLVGLGLLSVDGDAVRLTREGLCVADRVICELMA